MHRRFASCLVIVLIGTVLQGCGIFDGLVGTPAEMPPNSPPGTTTTIILVRHCERDPGLDPPLNDEGFARAQALRSALSEHGVSAIYCTNYLRNRQSVEPIAQHLGLEANLVNPALYADTPGTAANIIAEILDVHRGGAVLFCGNVGTILDIPGITETIYQQLGGTGRAPNRYQDMFICVVPDEGPTRFIKAEYGGPSSLDP